MFLRLLVPTRIVEILVGRFEMPPARILVEALPMWGLVVLGAAGALWSVRRGPYVSRVGALIVILLLLLVTVGKSWFAFVTGPLGWRLLTVVQAALALAAIPALAGVARRMRASITPRSRRAVVVVAMGAAVAGSALWSQSLRPVVVRPTSPEMRDVRAVWDWLRTHAQPTWGRVYVQDTSFTEAAPARLRQSHVMARTAAEASVRQLGAGYSAVPFPTVRWTAAEFGNVFGVRLRNSEHLRRVREAAWLSNTSHLVVCDPQIASRLAGTGLYEAAFRAGTFTVLREIEPSSTWAAWIPPRAGADAQASGDVQVERYETGQFELRADVRSAGGAVLVKVAYHPFWTLTSREASLPQETRLVQDDWGLLQIIGLPPGRHALELAYVPPRWPVALTIAAVLVVAALGVRRRTLPGVS